MTMSREALKEKFEDTRDIFVAFGDRYRQDIIITLSEKPHITVRELAEHVQLSRPAVSHHIKILKEAGLLGEQKEGRRTYYYPTPKEPLKKITELIDASNDWIK